LSVKMDSMMSLSTRLSAFAREFSAAFDGADLTPHPAAALWLSRESNRRLPISEKELGVVFMPHGADDAWNRTMLRAVGAPPRRILSPSAFATVGGLEDSSLFAEALFERAADLSRAPASETVFLVAHGSGDDAEDLQWRRVLDSLCAQVASLAKRAGRPF